jgi:glycosyltransferase involved in cell wall biosynthesis
MRLINRGKHQYEGEPLNTEIEVSDEVGNARLRDFAGSTRFCFERADYELKLTGPVDQSEKVTVLIPVYNNEKYILESVMSILDQTYKNLDILICDDGSTDGTSKILQELAASYENVKVIRNKTNQGVGAARQRLIKSCKTRVAAWQDGDDIAKSERIEKQMGGLQELEKTLPDKNFMIFCDWDIVGANAEYNRQRLCKQLNCMLFVIVPKMPVPDATLRCGEDEKWHGEMIDAGYFEANVPKVLQSYREHDESLTRQRIKKEGA